MVAMATSKVGLGRQVWNFGRHYLEMCVVMCAAGVPLTLGAVAAATALAGSSVRELYPEASLLLIAFTLALPMTAWMLFRGMPVRPTLEMAAAALGVAGAVIIAAVVGIAGREALQLSVGQVCGLSCVAMLVVMLLRLDLYTGRTGHHMRHAAHPA